MKDLRMEKPYVTVFVTMSADGKISSITRESRLSCPYDKMRLHSLRAINDAVMIGANTALLDNPELTARHVSGSNPIRILVDGKLKVPLTLNMFNVNAAPTIVLTSSGAPRDKINYLVRKGVKVNTLNSVNNEVDLEVGLHKLYKEGIRSILVEGGGELIWSLFKHDLVDEFRVTISPYIVGGRNSVTPVGGRGFTSVGEWIKLRLINYLMCECGQEIHLIYRVIHKYRQDKF